MTASVTAASAVQELLDRGWDPGQPTPQTIFDLEDLRTRAAQHQAAAEACAVTLAYSVKTNPMPGLITELAALGYSFEVINLAEVDLVTSLGVPLDRIVLTGPAKFVPHANPPGGIGTVMCNTPAELRTFAAMSMPPRVAGLRIRIDEMQSRFGVNITTSTGIEQAANALRVLPEYGIAPALHMHSFDSGTGGTALWRTRMATVLDAAAALQEHLGFAFHTLDLGGSYRSAGLTELLTSDDGIAMLERIREEFPGCARIVLEPGFAISAGSGVVYARVVALAPGEATLDASVMELPWPNPARPVFRRTASGEWEAVTSGTATVYGRLPMESDCLLTEVNIKQWAIGDVLAFGDAGAYDRVFRMTAGRGTLAPL